MSTSITTRQTAGTGATVKGAPLSNAEVDNNFIGLNQAVQPAGGTAGQILAKIDATNFNSQWIDNYATQVKLQVKNATGSTINKGAVVYISGATGANALISLAQANGDSTSATTVGFLESTLATGDSGLAVVTGVIAGIDTSLATEGDPVWLSPTTAGGVVYGAANKPQAPNHLVYLGTVTRAHATVGEIQVHISNGWEIEELHDVKITSKANNDIIQYDSTLGVWKNVTPATARTNLGLAIGTNVQAWDADLDAIAGLAGTSGLLKKTAANTWSLDTNTYLTGNQSITVSGDATGSGATAITLTLANSGVSAGTYTKVTVDAKGRVTTGASLSSSDVTTALGYTPYNSTNPSGYITSSGNAATTSQRNFSGDISATGQGRFTGWYTGNAATGFAAEIGVSAGQGYIFTYNRDTGTYGTLNIAASAANMQFSGSTINVNSGALQQGGNQVLHAGNYSSYALPLSGGTLSGAIRAPQITAGGSTNTDVQFGVQGTSHLAGDTYLGGSVGNVNSWSARLTSSGGTTTLSSSRFVVDRFGYGSQPLIDAQLSLITLGQPTRIEGGIRQGADMARPLAQWSATSATGMVYFELPGNTGNHGMVHAVIDIYEYSSNSVSTVIVGGHNWNGAWYNVGANVIGQTDKAVRLGARGGKYVICIGSAGSSWSYGTVVLRKIHNGGYYSGIMDMGAAFAAAITTSESLTWDSGDLRNLRTPAGFNAGGAITQNGNQVLHAGNYTSYSPSLTGSGATGTWGIRITGFANSGSPRLYSTDSGYSYDSSTPYYGYLTYNSGANRWRFKVSPATPDSVEVAYADAAGSVSGLTLTSNANGINPDSVTQNQIGYNTSVSLFGQTDGGLYSSAYSSSWIHQIYGDFRTGQIAIRGKNSGTWQAWRTVLDSSNYTSYAAPATHYHDRIYNGASGSSSYLLLSSGNELEFFDSAGAIQPLYLQYSGAADSLRGPGGNVILHAGNYSSYALPLSGGTMSGAISTNVSGTSIFIGSQNVSTSNALRINWHTDSDLNYYIGKRGGTWTQPMDIAFYTGIRYHAHNAYGGHRWYTTGVDSTLSFSVGDGDNNVRATDTIYAAHYRGNANVGGTGEASHHPAGIYSNGTNWLYGTIYTNGNGIYAGGAYSEVTAYRANRANGNFYIDDNYGCGVVGAYASTRYQGVFAMGDSYKLPADGTSTGSLYGLAWSHPNAGGAAGNLTDHGLLVINNGVFRCAISNSIVASSNITAYSDERLKTNWRDMPENYVARLARVKVGIYDRTDEEDVTQVGVSAQSFRELLPQAITTAKDEMGTLAVSYGNAALASAVELAKDNVELRARIERLESLISKLIGD